MMTASRFARLYRALFLLALGFLPACLGATGPAGSPAAGAGGGSFGSPEAGVEAKADGLGGVTTDVAQADSGKPHPGGSAAPGNDWQEPHPHNLVGTAEPVCKEQGPVLAVEANSYRYRLKGSVFEFVESETPPLKPLTSCAGRIVRVMRGDLQSDLETLQCKDFPLTAACELDAVVSLWVRTQSEENVFEPLHFGLSAQSLAPDTVACEKDAVSNKEGAAFLPLAGVVDFSEIPQSGVPACPVRSAKGL